MQNVRRRTPTADESTPSPGRTRGRPRAFDRDAALDAAMRLFWRKGFAATSISDLTDAMGIGSPSLYAAFRSKEELYAEALRRFADEAASMIWSAFDRAGSARAAMESLLLAAAAEFPATPGKPAGCMVTLSAAGAEGCAALGDLVSGGRREGLHRFEARLARAVQDGELRPGTDVPAMSRFYQAVQHGMALQARDGASRAELESVARAAMAAWPQPG